MSTGEDTTQTRTTRVRPDNQSGVPDPPCMAPSPHPVPASRHHHGANSRRPYPMVRSPRAVDGTLAGSIAPSWQCVHVMAFAPTSPRRVIDWLRRLSSSPHR